MRTLLFYACLPLVAYTGLKRPFWGFLLYLSANIIRPEMLFWGGNTGAIFFKISIGFTLIGFFLRGQDIFEPLGKREFWLMLWVWIAIEVSLYTAVLPLAPKAGVYAEEFFKMWILSWLLLGLVKDKEQILKMANFLLVMVSLLCLWGWDQSFRGNERLEGMGIGDSNGVAAFIVLFFPMALHKLLTAEERKDKIFGIVSTVLLGLMIVFTQSRGGFLGMAAGVFYLFLLTPQKKKLLIGFTLLIVMASPFISDSYLNRLSTINSQQEGRDFSAGSRLVLWQAGLYVFRDNPLFGVGFLNYDRAKMPYKENLRRKIDTDLLDYSFREHKVGHNTWICQLLAEGGLFLTIPYLWLLFGFFWGSRCVRSRLTVAEEDKTVLYLLYGLEAGIFGHCIAIVFINNLLGIFLPVDLIFGMQIIRLLQRTNKKNSISGHTVLPRQINT